MDTYEQLAASVLVAHQRRDSGSCLCGWAELGRPHADHVASVLAAAGALQTSPSGRVNELRCHVEGCGDATTRDTPLCTAHWRSIPEELRHDFMRLSRRVVGAVPF